MAEDKKAQHEQILRDARRGISEQEAGADLIRVNLERNRDQWPADLVARAEEVLRESTEIVAQLRDHADAIEKGLRDGDSD